MLYESVMLLGSCLCERLEPMGVMAGTIVYGPLLHTCCNAVSHAAGERLLVVDSVNQRFIRLDRKILKHLLSVEHLAGIVLLRTLFRNLDRNRLSVGSLLHDFES